MKRMSLYIMAALLCLVGGVSADFAFNYDYYRARARYVEYRRLHPYGCAGGVVPGSVLVAPVEAKRTRCQ